MKSTVALVALALAMASTAAAQPGQTSPPHPDPQPSLAEPAPSQAEPSPAQPLPSGARSEGVALGLSIGGTAVSWTMIGVAAALAHPGNRTTATVAGAGVLGTVLAPSFGHWYAGKFATRGLGLRLAGAGLATLGFIGVIVACEDECTPTLQEALLIGGVGLAIAGTIDDIVTVPRDVQRHNQRLYDTSIVPVVHHDTRSVGLAITGRF
jgi:hypothetical protein